MITLDNLSYQYPKGAKAIADISTSIGAGVHLLMGENGAGKTTLLKLLAGTLYPTAGRINACGFTPSCRQVDFLNTVFLLEEDMHIPARTINEWAAIHGCFYPRFNAQTLRDNLARMQMTGDEPLSKLSLGLAKKARVAYALSLGVDLLMLDEPTNGIDLNARMAIRNIIARNMSDENTIIIATHSVQDFESLFDGVILLYRSQLAFNMPVWKIGERLLFESSPMPAYKPLFQDMEDGLYRSIKPNLNDDESKVSLTLLYRALQSKNRSTILECLCHE